MANRHLLRSILMQALYEWEFHPKESLPAIALRQVRAAGKGDDDVTYVEATAEGIVEHFEDLNKHIIKNAPEWPLDQIASVDRAVLRLGIYEVLYSDDVPSKVAINEAVELAKAYGGESSGPFINGVLGTIYRASDRYKEEHDPDSSDTK
jgi:N utilization substance protein B